MHFTSYTNIRSENDSAITYNEDLLFESFDNYNKKISKAALEQVYDIEESIIQPVLTIQKTRNMIISKFSAIINDNLSDISVMEENLKKIKKQNIKNLNKSN